MGDENIYKATEVDDDKKHIVYREEHRPARPLSQFEMDQAIRRKAMVYALMPELVPQIRDMVEKGLIRGWAAVCFVKDKTTGEEV